MRFFPNNKSDVKEEEPFILTEDAPFAIQEAYKTLRTNLMFSLPGEKCKVIVVTSSSPHEGKSVTAINLAISLAENSVKTLLIDCDLRLPTVAQKLGVKSKPGLTNLLYETDNDGKVMHRLPCGLCVMSAGDTPPNPTETLGSEKMASAIKGFADSFEYIILDTPPIGVVSDAAILSKSASGVILVVRQGVAASEKVDYSVNQLRMAGANILGCVMTSTAAVKKDYGNYGYDR